MANSMTSLGISGIVVGNAVTGDDFFDRTAEMQELQELLSAGAHVMVTAQRRIGKTSLLLEAGNRLPEDFVFLFVDVQSCTTEVDAIEKLTLEAKGHREIGSRILDVFRNVLAGSLAKLEEISVSELGLKVREGLASDWRAKANEVLERLAGLEKRVVVCLDELPVLVSAILSGDEARMTPERALRARLFLSWLREATIRYRGRISFVISGSIGLEPLLSRAGISDTMNTFTPLRVGPWSAEEAWAYVEDRAHRCGLVLEPGACDRLLGCLGIFIPHHVAMFLHFVRLDARRRKESRCSAADVERVYLHSMLSVQGHVDLATYEDRLKKVVAPEELRVALDLLTEAAMVGRLTLAAARSIVLAHGFAEAVALDTLRFLLGVFEHDGYLRRDGQDYVFESHLLRDWWKHRFGFGYVSAAER